MGAPEADWKIHDVIRAVSDAALASCQIAGFVVIVEAGQPVEPLDSQDHPVRMLSAFVGPYGDQAIHGRSEGLEWAAVLPGSDQILSTWSAYADDRGVCLIEGEFYSDAWGHRPAIGADTELARRVMERVLLKGPDQLKALNGVFSGAVYSTRHRQLWVFVDRVGSRPLYYRAHRGRFEVSTNIYAFRGAPAPPGVDPHALNEHLILGFPTDSKTVFEEVRLVPPGKLIEWSRGTIQESRYHHFPERREHQSLVEGAEMVLAALDNHVRSLPLGARTCGIALSGGKDSRVVLGALLRANIRPHAITFMAENDVGNALRLCARLGLPSRAVHENPGGDGVAFHWDSSILQDGCGAGWGFLSAAAAASLEGLPLLTGFAGDYLSGSWAGIEPWRLSSPEALARREYALRGPEVPPALVAASLRPDLVVPYEDVIAAWIESVRRESRDAPDLVTTYVMHRTSHRNRRRIVPSFHTMRSMCTVIHPFADRFVMDAYLQLPNTSLVAQGVHCLAAMSGPPALGQVPTGASWLPLKYEFRARGWLEQAKRLRDQALRATEGRWPGWPRRALWGGHQRHLAVIRESELFTWSGVKSILDELAPRGQAITKFAATAMHVACLTGADLPSAPEPLFLKPFKPSVETR